MRQVREVSIAGISVVAYSSIEQLIEQEIYSEGVITPGFAIAINPEKIISANEDNKVKEILNSATLRFPDGIGVSYVMSKKLRRKVVRIPGCELWQQLLEITVTHQTPIFIIGATPETLAKTVGKLSDKGVNVVGWQHGFFADADIDGIIESIKLSQAEIVTVALGSPKQEIFIQQCRKVLPQIFYMGVGGTYDVYTGNVKRAPWFFRTIHCEWLYRILSQPTRASRQLKLLTYVKMYIFGKL